MSYWDKEYPTHIEVPEGYWTITTTMDYDFEYVISDDGEDESK